MRCAQEMRRAVQTMRDEQRASSASVQPTGRQRSLADMQELIHGLREEQQQAKAALHACQQSMRQARGVAAMHLWEGWERHCRGRLFQRWVAVALEIGRGEVAAERDQLTEHMRKERRQVETLESQLRAGGCAAAAGLRTANTCTYTRRARVVASLSRRSRRRLLPLSH